MPSVIKGYEYDIFISYRQKDNKADKWVTHFVEALKDEIEATFKEDICLYFDENPHDGLLETHDVDQSLCEKIKVLVFIPIISQTYCDPNCFAWQNEFIAFRDFAKEDKLGLDISLANGNVCKRILPVRIHEIDATDQELYEKETGGVMRSVDFIYKAAGVNRPLNADENNPLGNQNITFYNDQINKVANTLKEILFGISSNNQNGESVIKNDSPDGLEGITGLNEKSIIVLPFENMSSDPEQEYFSDGLTEEVIADLSHMHELLVISRSSAMTFKGKKCTIGEIAEKVHVRYVLEGSVRKAGNNLRITAQLIDAFNDSHIWAEKYAGTLDDVFDIQEKVSHDIVAALKVKLTTKEKAKIASRPIDDLEAYDFYLKAYQEFWQGSKDALDRALKYLQHAAEIMGDNDLIYSGMAFIYLQYFSIGFKQEDYLAKSEQFSQKALALNPDSSTAYHVMGFAAMRVHGNPDDAVRYLKHALALEPSLLPSLYSLIALYGYIGKIPAASPLVEKLKRIDPLSHQTYYFVGHLYFFDGKYDLALDPFQHIYEMKPLNPINWVYAWALACCNKYEEAISVIDSLTTAKINTGPIKFSQILKYTLLEDHDEVLKLITPEAQKVGKRGETSSYFFSSMLAYLGQNEKAMDFLKNAVNRGFINYPFIAEKDPFMKKIRGEKKFKELMVVVKNKWEKFEG